MNFLYDYCDNILPVIKLAKNVYNLLQWAIPIALILFGMIDLGKAVIAGKEDEMKKAQGTLIKRFIYAVLIFFVFTLVTFVMGIVADTGVGDTDSWIDCWNQASYIYTINGLLR